jgi:hypothetical protein
MVKGEILIRYSYKETKLEDNKSFIPDEIISDKIIKDDKSSPDRSLPELLIASGKETKAEESIRCAVCQHGITTNQQRTFIDGAHEHTFVNPAGHIYNIGCYKEAPGCVETGELALEHTWFKGYIWNYALCSRCFSHLGWVYHAKEGSGFFGLILSKLIFPV